jgi:hypothetical protein
MKIKRPQTRSAFITSQATMGSGRGPEGGARGTFSLLTVFLETNSIFWVFLANIMFLPNAGKFGPPLERSLRTSMQVTFQFLAQFLCVGMCNQMSQGRRVLFTIVFRVVLVKVLAAVTFIINILATLNDCVTVCSMDLGKQFFYSFKI